MVCCMYYTDVFVGSNDIDKLNNALNAELGSFKDDSNDLNELVHGLCLFMGYPSCLCKPKKSVEDSLKKISKELKEELENYECLQSNSKPSLNCDSCSTSVVCKCCVLDCISKVLNCGCVKGSNNNDCKCSIDDTQRCCKDLLEKLKASLSLLNLKADMEKLCSCTENCCDKGVCTQKGSSKCDLCSPKNFSEFAMTGLGICPMNPRKLAGKLEGYFKPKTQGSSGCDCTCNGKTPSCCCLACPDQTCSSQHCSGSSSGSSTGCSCAQAPKDCPCKDFCSKIKDIKIPADSKERTCCKGGTECHCKLGGSKCSGECCKGDKDSLKCMIRRLVKFFSGLGSHSGNFFKSCCDLLCVAKTCYFLHNTLKDTTQGDGQTFYNALQTLKYSSPCGHDLWRVLNDFLQCCFRIFNPDKKFVEKKVKNFQENCKCKDATKSKQSPPSPCNCCSKSGTPCEACTSLFADSKLMSILRHGYVSSYDSASAKWDSLCPKPSSSTCCCGLSSCSCSKSSSPCCKLSSPCDPSQCCPDCPQRKAAKIFLGMLPCLYYGLKIVFDRCKYGSDFPDWSLQNISQGSIGSFLFAWGFESSNLSSKNASDLPPVLDILYGSSGKFESLLDLVSKKYFVPSGSRSPSTSDPSPSTVRQMLLWLYGLPFTSGFSSLVLHCRTLSLPLDNAFHPDAVCYYIHASCFLLPLAVISTIQDPVSTAAFFPSSSEFSKFFYPSDPSSLADMFFDYIRKVYIAFNFLRFQCKRVPGQGGWQNCWYGKSCKTTGTFSSPSCCSTPGPSSQGYLCTASGSNPDVHGKHCWEGKCLGSSSTCSTVHPQGQKCSNPCPHPLQAFLCDSNPQSPSSPFRLPFSIARLDFSKTPPTILDASSDKFLTMGFSKSNLPSPGKKGLDLGHDIYGFCKDGFYPLTRLVQFILCISQRPPETLLDLYAFFVRFKDSSVFKNNFVNWIEGEPGEYSGEDLKNALEKLYGSHSGDHSPANLYSLYDCHATKNSSNPTCGPYLHALTEEVSGVFTPELCSMYLSWICHLTKDFKALLEKFKKDFEDSCEHCSSGSCSSIVECPCALPFLYSYGFTFFSPNSLNCVTPSGNSRHSIPGQGKEAGKHFEGDKGCTKKSCFEFIIQLERVISGKPFEKLLNAIEAFLWSIRKPFFLFVLAFWAFVMSYFLYVQLYKLDLLELNSHDHLPRSFKILPSTLFSDASSKLKDLSYFTL
ncbi:variant erythrocyte surface antigen-1 family protein [Babesia divergens]|uniref:Variant erythrocyte surface antigen-1 family protein n=1 Tax=Babesia divergens TaxID=32595 RepID=A0AAD9LH21_BABDI|nr:variant erythrocyte surface antigen-1 family protein [Babesia divergens]